MGRRGGQPVGRWSREGVGAQIRPLGQIITPIHRLHGPNPGTRICTSNFAGHRAHRGLSCSLAHQGAPATSYTVLNTGQASQPACCRAVQDWTLSLWDSDLSSCFNYRRSAMKGLLGPLTECSLGSGLPGEEDDYKPTLAACMLQGS